MYEACVQAAESISVPGHDYEKILSGCCTAYGGQVTKDKNGDFECWFAPTLIQGSSSGPGSQAAGHLPTDATHI
ncbi:hypothetical protein C8E89_12834 [Mycolicibacterium moriokaense]|uniref:Uncharacterized protein n=1 Tax=Mycolicibacterium moriokaense TaxID=39691 RepID=A0A318H8C1_9MYCO|nr:hypothetical protein C8E89_12834 [Mycolicibacterium moriokaense]